MSTSSAIIRKKKEKRIISSTVGYCFVIVLVVLLVMSNLLTDSYKQLLQNERADSMQSIAVASSAVLGHTSINEGMDYPLPLYEYDDNKSYIVSIYTKTTDSFRLLYSSNGSTSDSYLSGVGSEYVNCFELQETAFTRRVENGTEYVCAIAPIISMQNTVSGILEIRMPYSDFTSSVNGMSLSWVFTIFSIAISMGIMIFELNLFVSTLSNGLTPNVPMLIVYGDNAVRFLSFFMALGAVMPPITLYTFLKDSWGDNLPLVNMLTVLGIIVYIVFFYGFTSLRAYIKSKLTSRISLLFVTALGYLFCLISGIVNNGVFTLVMTPFIAFCCGMPSDALRDYRINASALRYKGFDDRTVHNLQFGSYLLGASVGTVVAGICYERYGLLIVSIISGAVLILTSVGIVYFMKGNNTVREPQLFISKWFELLADKYVGRFLLSSYTIIGINIAFLIVFVPSFLDGVGISLATSSFYYLLATLAACLISTMIKRRYSYVLTSKVRVIISSTASLLAFAIFALVPTAKVLCISVMLVGISLGIHDFYYLYVLYLLSVNRFKVNIRKVAEASVTFGFIISSLIFGIALASDKIRIVFLVSLILFFLIGFIYPMSAYSNDVDDKDPTKRRTSKPAKKSKPKTQVTQAVVNPEMNNIPESPVNDIQGGADNGYVE